MNLYPAQRRATASQRGSILVVCLVLAGLGTLGTAAWFSLLNARSSQVEASLEAIQRRNASANARAVARLALYARSLHEDAPLDADLTLTFPDGRTRAILHAYAGVPLRHDVLGPPSRNGVTPGSSHSVDARLDIEDGIGTSPWVQRLRNQHPALSGELLSLHAPVQPTDPTPLIMGDLRVKGRAAFWDAAARDFDQGLRAEEYLLPGRIAGATTFLNPRGEEVLPLNAPPYRRTTGHAESGPAYQGELELLDPVINPQNSYLARLAPSLPFQLRGDTARSESTAPPTKAAGPDDATHLAFIEAQPPLSIATELSQHSDLSSTVLLACLAKANPPLTLRQICQIFEAQTHLPQDALAALMNAIDETTLEESIDNRLLQMNARNGTIYHSNGRGSLQVFLDHPDLHHIVVEDLSRLRLVGQSDSGAASAAVSQSPIVLVVDNRAGRSLERIELFHENHRPLILVLASARALPMETVVQFRGAFPFPEWRSIVELQGTGLAFDLSAIADAKLLGGIRGNHRLSVEHGTLTLEMDPETYRLAPLLSREAWIETNRL